MEHAEMIFKLHEKTGISMDEARDVLSRANWDMLDALSILEREGKIPPLTSSMTTDIPRTQYETVRPTASQRGRYRANSGAFGEKLKALFILSLKKALVVKRHGKEILVLPLLLAIIVGMCMFWVMVTAAFIGLMTDCTYSIEDRT